MSINDHDEQQQSQITNVIKLGKDQSYLTHAQINDMLPSLVDTENFDVIINILENMNIKVFEQPPGEDELVALLASTEEAPEDIDEAATVIASVDKETGRVTDPVRAYMREMGTVELLTREGEIKIAKRIEHGIYQVLQSIASYPETILLVLNAYESFLKEEMRLSDIISGFVDGDDEESSAPPSSIGSMLDDTQQDISDHDDSSDGGDDDVDTDDDDGSVGGDVDDGPSPEQAKEYFDDLRQKYDEAVVALKSKGKNDKHAQELVDKMLASFLKLKLTSKQVDRLTKHFRRLRNHVREFERSIMRLCIERAKIPRKIFIETFPGQETNLDYLDELKRKNKKLDVALIDTYTRDIKLLQERLF